MAEGGAGVLRRLVEDPGALGRVAKTALEICHFDPVGNDEGKAPGAKEVCEAACYDCLRSYTNQPDHPLLDRKLPTGYLLSLMQANVNAGPTGLTRQEQFERLSRLAASGTRPDFLYKVDQVAVYVDGPPHDFPERHARDTQQQAAMEDLGYVVLRFRHDQDWGPLLKKYPSVFGSG